MEDIKKFFREKEENFTIYVVERRFAAERGAEYFKSYKNTPNYIDSNKNIESKLQSIIKTICKKTPNLTELVDACFKSNSPIGIAEVITALSKLFSANEHQAAGIEALDPIIIQEGNIIQKYIDQIVTLHQKSILKPVIIIILKDNDFGRAKKIFSKCPHNTNIKMIRNNGESEFFKVINCGADSTEEFLDSFAEQCFSTCSNTKRNVIYNEEWAQDSNIKLYAPTILQIRSSLLFRDKTTVKDDLNNFINTIVLNNQNKNDALLLSFECILKLFRVFCNDGGKKDMKDALNIAKDLNNEILLAHVYRNAYFLDDFSLSDRLLMMEKAYNIFKNNNMEDHAIYCKNNKLVRQFDTESVSVYDFLDLKNEAVHNVPGLVGMSHIFNNVGAALLTNGFPDKSIECFNKGLDYAYSPERCVQKVALLSNRCIANSYCYNKTDESELEMILKLIFDNKEMLNLPFLSARYALNIIALAFSDDKSFGNNLLLKYPVRSLIQNSLNEHILGSGQLILQTEILKNKYGDIPQLNSLTIGPQFLEAKGIRKEFIIKSTFNPCSFSTWF